jgi:hypothetical protein
MPNGNKKAFCAAYGEIARLKARSRLRDMKIINPLRIGARVDRAFAAKGAKPAWADYMRACVKKVCDADICYFLKGWDASGGARVERYLAKRLEIPCADSIEELEAAIRGKITGAGDEN